MYVTYGIHVWPNGYSSDLVIAIINGKRLGHMCSKGHDYCYNQWYHRYPKYNLLIAKSWAHSPSALVERSGYIPPESYYGDLVEDTAASINQRKAGTQLWHNVIHLPIRRCGFEYS